jgi:hypothetical protein
MCLQTLRVGAMAQFYNSWLLMTPALLNFVMKPMESNTP